MAREIWQILGLRRATLRDLNGVAEVVTPPRTPLLMAFGDVEGKESTRRLHTLDDWRQQEPVERIVNAILLCAIRDGAQQITLEPQARGVHVRFTLIDPRSDPASPQVRDHMKLPLLALEPVVNRVKSLACLDGRNRLEQWGSIHLRVDEKAYDLQVSTHPTPWGERIELRFPEVS